MIIHDTFSGFLLTPFLNFCCKTNCVLKRRFQSMLIFKLDSVAFKGSTNKHR